MHKNHAFLIPRCINYKKILIILLFLFKKYIFAFIEWRLTDNYNR